jgi:hypothetical protein
VHFAGFDFGASNGKLGLRGAVAGQLWAVAVLSVVGLLPSLPPPVLQEIIWGIESPLLQPSPIPPVRAVKDQNISELSCKVRTCACLVYEGSAQMLHAIFSGKH